MLNKKRSSEIARTAIDVKTTLTLWGRAAGRCEMCNKLLYCDSKYGDMANFAENAHIHAVGTTGPRHRDEMTQDEINQIDNLMLLCEEHHHLIDTKPEDYSGKFLCAKKEEHESRVRRVTDIQEEASCKMVSFFSNVDKVDVYGDTIAFKRAVIRDKMYPKQDEPIVLHMGAPTRYIASKENIELKANELAYQVHLAFEGIKKEERIAIFSLAPQPLLFKLGMLLCDQLDTHVFQYHREGDKWAWPEDNTSVVEYVTKNTHYSSNDVVALVIDLSAEIVDARITCVLGDDCSIYHLTIAEPNRDFVLNKRIQSGFVRVFRKVLEEIKNAHPKARRIHLFPAMPQSLAICAGMDYMPKADLPVTLYEQVDTSNGFIKTITIGGE